MWADRIVGESRDGFGFFLENRENEVGYQSLMVPGSLLAFYEAVRDFGSMDWKDICAPAIDIARRGYTVRPHMHDYFTAPPSKGRIATHEKLRYSETGKALFFDEVEKIKAVGSSIESPDMARSLERIAKDGPDVFYKGEMAEEIIADVTANGGMLSAADLAGYRTIRMPPLWGTYREHRISTVNPPGGGVLVLEMLNILENFELSRFTHNSAEYIRIVAEAMKYATIDKDARVGDPLFVDVPIEELVSKAYARKLAERIVRGKKASVDRLDPIDESPHTTHVCSLDSRGDMVTMTHSLGMPSGAITPGLGFMYNGCMAVFDPRPGRAGSIAPGKSRFTAMSPTIVFRGDNPRLAIGAPGGTYITMAVLQGIVNVLDFGMNMLEAVSAPRITANSNTIDVSNRIPTWTTRELESQGYPVARSPLSYAFAALHGIRIDGHTVEGAADPARDGMALDV
jgi:gamma-glutamyltranspeptidase/glutathione hydrolase